MEPIELTLAALASLMITKATEKTGEKFGEKLLEQGGNLLQQLRRRSPQTASAIEKVNETPLNWGETVIDVKATAANYPEVAQAVEAVEATISNDTELKKILEDIAATIKSQPKSTQNYHNTIEKVVNLAQGENASINIEKQDIKL
jgi:hypothetical protein